MSEDVKKTKTKEPMETQQADVHNPWQVMKTIRLPRGRADEARSEYVGVNGKNYQVPCGKEVEVPLPIYEVLMRREEAQDELQDYRDSIPNESYYNI